jgi:SAM-dependent methyltransferase
MLATAVRYLVGYRKRREAFMGKQEIDANKRTWEEIAPKYFGRTALPEWGVFAIERNNESLIGEIEGKTFLEIACGSGHSIEYLIRNGASRVYALDFSHTQIDIARQTNYEAVHDRKVILFEQPMEYSIALPEQVDTVFSIYGLGWTTDIDRVFQNVNSYLKMDGKFVWSWEHPMYPRVEYNNGQFAFVQSYHDEGLNLEEDWKATGRYIATRKISTWYNSLRKHGFDVMRILEPEPHAASEEEQNPEKYYSLPRANLVPATVIFDCKKAVDFT